MKTLNFWTAPVMAVAALFSPVGSIAAPEMATLAAVPDNTPVDFEVFLPLRDKPGLEALLRDQQTPGSADYHKWLTPAEFGARFGPTADQMTGAAAALRQGGLTITATNTRSLHVTTTAGQAARTFQTKLRRSMDVDGSSHIAATGSLIMPHALSGYGAVIPAFSRLPNRRTHSRRVALPPETTLTSGSHRTPDNRSSNVGGYYYDDLKQAYDYPAADTRLPSGRLLNGTGVPVAILMADLAANSDVAAMFKAENYTATTGLAPPTFTVAKVDGGGQLGGPGTDEASLDIEEVLGGAPGAKVTLFSLPDLSDGHILDGYVDIIDSNNYDVVNSSFGGCELLYTSDYNNGVDYTGVLQIYHEEFQQGNAQGITFVASSGDSGGRACPSVNYFNGAKNAKFVASVENPADDPNVTAVGGTNLVTTSPPSPQSKPPTLTSAYVGENAFGDPEIPYDAYGLGANISGGFWGAGGGQSVIFSAPSYQSWTNSGSTGRTVPDVGMQVGGCPAGISKQPCGPNRSYVIVWVGGQTVGLIGTSVSSPEFVSAVALHIQNSGGRVGNLNTYLYSQGLAQRMAGGRYAKSAQALFHLKINGFDGVWTQDQPPGMDYNYYVGNGTPDVRKLFGMTTYPAAGDPQTPSNP